MRSFFLLLFLLSSAWRGFGQVHDTLVYKGNRKLTWQDFKGKPDFLDKSKGAQITVTINLKVRKVNFWTGRPTYDAFAVAFTDASWVKAGYKDDYTLAHEQLHFDIAHIYAETLELEINSSQKPVREKERIAEIVNKYLKEMGDYQVLYDRETRGGNHTARQKEWAKKVEADLKVINKVL